MVFWTYLSSWLRKLHFQKVNEDEDEDEEQRNEKMMSNRWNKQTIFKQPFTSQQIQFAFQHSQWPIVPQWLFACFRFLSALYFSTWLITSWVHFNDNNKGGVGKWFIFITNWSFLTLVAQSIGLTLPIIRRKRSKCQRSKRMSVITKQNHHASVVHQVPSQLTNDNMSFEEDNCPEDDGVQILPNPNGHGLKKQIYHKISRHRQLQRQLSIENNDQNKLSKTTERQLSIQDEQVGCSDQLKFVDNRKMVETRDANGLTGINNKRYNDLIQNGNSSGDGQDLFDDSEDETEVLVFENPKKSLAIGYSLLWALDNVASTMAIGVTFVFWTFLYKQQGLSAVSLHTHGINAIYVIADQLLSQRPRQLYHVYHPVLFGVAYVIFSAIYWSLGGTSPDGKSYVYTFLNWSEKPYQSVLFAFVFAILGVAIIYVALFVIYKLRTIAHRKFSSQIAAKNSLPSIQFTS